MEAQLFDLAGTQGLFALLFVGLFLYVLKDSKRREELIMEDKGRALEEARLSRRDGHKREIELIEHNNNIIKSLRELSKSNENIVSSMRTLDNKMCEKFDRVWDRLNIEDEVKPQKMLNEGVDKNDKVDKNDNE